MLSARVLLLGVDGVGKTTLLYQLKLNEKIQTLPTIGFNVEEIIHKNKKICIFDLGGGEKIIPLWKHYFQESKCIIYVIDIGDKSRLEYYIKAFDMLLKQHQDFRNIPIIIFGNKINDKIEFEPEEMLNSINLPPEISPYVLKGNAVTREGLPELLDYICDNIEFKEEEIKEENEEINEKEEDNTEKIVDKKELKVNMLGLDYSGKTTILYLLKLGEKVTTIPTIGFNVETVEKEGFDKKMAIWDIGGQKQIRPLWKHYFEKINGLIWVYDISDNETFEESQSELKTILEETSISQNIPLLIFANKNDLNKNGNKAEDFINGIKDYLNVRPYYIKECNENDLDSYKEGIDWLFSNLE